MDYLFIFRDDQNSFEPDEVRRIVEDIPGTRKLEETACIGSGISYEFAFHDDKTFVRLARDFRAITVHGTGEASQRMALEIQRRYPQPLRVTDLDYGFDLFLGEIGSVEEFTKKIRDAYAVPDTT